MVSLPMRPAYVMVVALAVQTTAVYVGDWLRRRGTHKDEAESKDMGIILPAALTLLTLLIGFSFSMAASRYDQRKTLEEAEANAISTEYVRADLVPGQTAHIQALLRDYLEQRIEFYTVRNWARLEKINTETEALESELWQAVATPANASPTPVMSLVAAGMNDVLNSQGYTQAMWWNRLPLNAWGLMFVVAISCNLLFGYNEHRIRRLRLLVLPLVISLPFFLIADMDSPRNGLIAVVPQNLLAFQAALH